MTRRWSLALVVALAAGVGFPGCSGNGDEATTTTSRRSSTTASSTTTTTTTTAPATTSTAPPNPTTAATASPTTAVPVRPDCSSRALLGGVEAVRPPAPGLYRYVRCSNGSAARTVAIGPGASPAQRTVTWSASFGDVTAMNDYGAAVTQASATVRPRTVSVSIGCTWDNPLLVYPVGIGLNSSWRSDGRCDMDFRQSLQFNRFSRVTGLRSFTVLGEAVRVLVIEETTDLLYVDNPRRNSTSWHSELTLFFDPVRGMPVYERGVSEATGQFPQARAVTEIVLGGFTAS